MSNTKTKKRTSRPLLIGYLEKISSKIFSDFPHELTELVGKEHGVYALYKGSSLYYVGLATNLRGRIKHHLRDKHAGKWDKFSLYLVRKADHIKELETLIMRVAKPAGNVGGGRFPKADNLKLKLETGIKDKQLTQLKGILGRKAPKKSTTKRATNTRKPPLSKAPVLSTYITKRFEIRRTYKGKLYKAYVNKNGTIRFEGNIYNSLSAAGKAVRKRHTNGWYFWKYKNSNDEWVHLDNLRTK